ncbi:MAG: hypothetical protein EA360_09795 [Balneolaceae bacterium]|nr:MAG: hypothetical protein EA360_09795 [Balneolaceae bacterium]
MITAGVVLLSLLDVSFGKTFAHEEMMSCMIPDIAGSHNNLTSCSFCTNRLPHENECCPFGLQKPVSMCGLKQPLKSRIVNMGSGRLAHCRISLRPESGGWQ